MRRPVHVAEMAVARYVGGVWVCVCFPSSFPEPKSRPRPAYSGQPRPQRMLMAHTPSSFIQFSHCPSPFPLCSHTQAGPGHGACPAPASPAVEWAVAAPVQALNNQLARPLSGPNTPLAAPLTAPVRRTGPSCSLVLGSEACPWLPNLVAQGRPVEGAGSALMNPATQFNQLTNQLSPSSLVTGGICVPFLGR